MILRKEVRETSENIAKGEFGSRKSVEKSAAHDHRQANRFALLSKSEATMDDESAIEFILRQEPLRKIIFDHRKWKDVSFDRVSMAANV